MPIKYFTVQEVSTPKGMGHRFDLYMTWDKTETLKMAHLICKFARIGVPVVLILAYAESDEDEVIYHYLDGKTTHGKVGTLRVIKESRPMG